MRKVEKLPQHDEFTFQAWQATPRVMPGAHVHTDIELNLFLDGGARYFLAGAFHALPPGRLAVFWAGMPHRLEALKQGTKYLCMTLPLAWFLGWNLDTAFVNRLLHGDMFLEPDEAAAEIDLRLFERWTIDLGSRRAELRRPALLEVEARLRRMAAENVVSLKPEQRVAATSECHQMERIAEYIGRNYREPLLHIEEIARAVTLAPGYTMTVFKDGTGMSIWDYVTRLRVSHAQRLLLTTDWTVQRIALECGFGSPGRSFVAFRRLSGTTPGVYRRS